MNVVESLQKKLTRPEAAEYLGVSPRTLANWHSSGRVKIPFYKVGRKKTIYLKSDLDAYLASVRQSA
ncbi:helix-turn-helix domain-containing protein [Salmonella enterica subsp. enterica serovar Amsterdam]|uniref:Helix-turn-helix domain-containing protein n=1 Tax=Salmonella enterica subsp. enterica serovar Abeokuta TaxID=2926665 RepID=A0A8T9IKK7_SALET|nr:helix-turn-helix domain-containing protein [Salmonella enterica]EAA6000266.1 DNA-binding protein [Salmonella enterica subsp. enterica serovar Oranienburg]ECC3633002.1 DNA-binding protein [Salmonella enterica subsp. enterica]EDI0415095.1 DNA-binding protein [Salmonella enterica subsp. enterica serovar Winterthur]EEH9714143.1 helix-turn-helix domain-containing protein [Salmonella enterica subsp. enterica serovar Vancouver]EJN2872331.1 helix-turn-helix domain-containing protein [Salmonella ent